VGRLDPAHVVDVFVYVVVLNLATQYLPSVITETFSISLLTAILLKLVLEVVVAVKKRVVGHLKGATTHMGRGAAALALLVMLPASKLLVLEVVDLVFGDAVSLGGFVPVTLLVFALLLARLGVRRLLAGQPAPTSR
jgi:hypothetical protein